MADATLKPIYAARAAITVSPASLASSSTFVAGQESTVIDNTSTRYMDALVSGKITVGTTPTANTQIRIYVGTIWQDAPSYPDVFDGTDSAETVTNVGILNSALKLAAILEVSAATSDVAQWIAAFSVKQLFGDIMPDKWFIFISHNTGVNLNSTGGNHAIEFLGVNYLADE
jgi:hypothetical protein